MRVIICGGRDFEDADRLYHFMDAANAARCITKVVHGGARGADSLGGQWAIAREIEVEVFPADWRTLRSRAGPIRNQQMADAGADACIAFPGGTGTADMCRRAQAAGIEVRKALSEGQDESSPLDPVAHRDMADDDAE
jgi:predicted Rossmann-fold nucleotide-binding protein